MRVLTAGDNHIARFAGHMMMGEKETSIVIRIEIGDLAVIHMKGSGGEAQVGKGQLEMA